MAILAHPDDESLGTGGALARGVLGELEQGPQFRARPRVPLDLDGHTPSLADAPWLRSHSDHGTIPSSARGAASIMARYSSRWPSGSRK